MCSVSYRESLKSEYKQLKNRISKLDNLICKESFENSSEYQTACNQLEVMRIYKSLLEERFRKIDDGKYYKWFTED